MLIKLNKKTYEELVKPENRTSAVSYDVSWEFLDKDKKSLQKYVKQACFAQMPSALAKHPETEYIRIFHTEPSKDRNTHNLTKDDVVRWLDLCLANNGLILKSNETTGLQIYKHGLTIPIRNPLATVDRVYIAGSLLRSPREFDVVVYKTINLVRKCGVQFWPAFYYAHSVSNPSTGHTFLFNGSKDVYVGGNNTSLAALKQFCNYFSTNKTIMPTIASYLYAYREKIKDKKPDKNDYTILFSWNVGKDFTPSSKEHKVDSKYLALPHVNEYLDAKSKEEEAAVYQKFQDLKI